jgi:acyl-CoA thioesterase-1
LKYAISKSKKGKAGVFVVSIPDYGYTPFGSKKQKIISKRLDAYNLICQTISKEMEVPFFNITDISRMDPTDNSLVAKDGLHPSGKQYGLWVESFYKNVMKQFGPN